LHDVETKGSGKAAGKKRARSSSAFGRKPRGADAAADAAAARQLSTLEVERVVRALWLQEAALLDLIYQSHGGGGGHRRRGGGGDGAAMCFMRTVLVTPNKLRPVSEVGGAKYEHAHNVILGKVLAATLDLNDLAARRADLAASAPPGGPDPAAQLFVRHTRDLQSAVRCPLPATNLIPLRCCPPVWRTHTGHIDKLINI
jgi:hypothetical protein